MNKPVSPQRWAHDITVILRTALGAERFPVDVKAVAREISAHKFPDDPITMIAGDVLPGFEGVLVPAPAGKKGWGIVYNKAITSPGRINFTLGHEFGHYLLHRLDHPKGIQCSSEDMARWESEYGQLEQQANAFAAALLMPLDDFRRQIGERERPDLETLTRCAKRYDVSLSAATLRWLQYTTGRSMLVVARDGFVLWARPSEPALKSGLFIKTRNCPPVELPSRALAARQNPESSETAETEHDSDVWLGTACKEHVLFSGRYDFSLSLLHFGDDARRSEIDEEPEEDTYDRMIRRTPGRSWRS